MLNLIKIRQELHSKPELSGKESNTVEYLKNIIKDLKPDSILDLSASLVIVFHGEKKGKNIAFRADVDALPIQELNTFKYASETPNIAHLCGHDGHTAILLGLAEKVSQNKPNEGSVVLIFQSAEETGQGAKLLMNNKEFLDLKIDEIYGFHNIPGYKLGTVILKSGSFTSASKGMIIKLIGASSHASEPEKGISPIPAMNKILTEIERLNSLDEFQKTRSFTTVVGIKAGDKNFGISPDSAEIYLTIRSGTNEDMDKLTQMIVGYVDNIASDVDLKYSIEYSEEFSAVKNDPKLSNSILSICNANALEKINLCNSFPWSEDFGYYTEKIKGVFLGIGAGTDQHGLHDQSYDFPDEIIETSVKTLYLIYETM
ncbi:MAG: amidohydrolase [Candidatus Delongbacteria bacterium]|nr:amidohydrolase [Candidatus Delongbacteria bacterium]